MRTDFFYKNLRYVVGIVLAVLLIASIIFSTKACKNAQILPYEVEIYYLVTEDVHVQAGAEFVRLEGGAGYLLENKGKEYVVLNVYFAQSDAKSVQDALSALGRKTQVISLSENTVKSRDKQGYLRLQKYIGALQSMYGCMNVFSQSIMLLEKGETQERVKEMLLKISAHLTYLSKIYGDYNRYAQVCVKTAENLTLYKNEILYVCDLRYILCDMAYEYMKLMKV